MTPRVDILPRCFACVTAVLAFLMVTFHAAHAQSTVSKMPPDNPAGDVGAAVLASKIIDVAHLLRLAKEVGYCDLRGDRWGWEVLSGLGQEASIIRRRARLLSDNPAKFDLYAVQVQQWLNLYMRADFPSRRVCDEAAANPDLSRLDDIDDRVTGQRR